MFKQMMKDLIQHNIIYNWLQDCWHKKDYRKWVLSGKPIPPPHTVKQMTVKAYAAKFGTNVFVETGTYLGEMVNAVKYIFKRIYSIELSSELYERAIKKFSRHKHISILQGDSAKVLPEVIHFIKEPCLFWFDAHYSAGITAKGEKETPILEEIKHVCSHSIEDHVILIDDARNFTGQNDYPKLEELRELILNQYPSYGFSVEDDIIRIHKKYY